MVHLEFLPFKEMILCGIFHFQLLFRSTVWKSSNHKLRLMRLFIDDRSFRYNESSRWVWRQWEILTLPSELILDFRNERHILTILKRIYKIMSVILEIIDVPAIGHLNILIVYLFLGSLEWIVWIKLVWIYDEFMRTSIGCHIVDQRIAFLCFLYTWKIVFVGLYIQNLVNKTFLQKDLQFFLIIRVTRLTWIRLFLKTDYYIINEVFYLRDNLSDKFRSLECNNT